MIELKHIHSPDNPKFKDWQKLLARKYRDREGLFLVEGEVLIKDAIKSGGEIVSVIVSSQEEEPTKTINNILSVCDIEPKLFMLNGELFKKLSQTENGRLILAVAKRPNAERSNACEGIGSSGNILILDRIQDPGNMGTLIRTADAAGFKKILAIKGTVDPFSPKVVRSAAGSVFRIPIEFVDDINDLKRNLERTSNNDGGKTSIRIVATSMNAENDYWNADLSGPVAIVIGNEGAGISEELLDISDIKIRIPMTGTIESLNAAVSGALIMYEAFRQNNNTL